MASARVVREAQHTGGEAGVTGRAGGCVARRLIAGAAVVLAGVSSLALVAVPAAGAIMPRLGSPAGAMLGAASRFPFGAEWLEPGPAAAAKTGASVGKSPDRAAGVAVQSVGGTVFLSGVACASGASCLAVGQNRSGADVVVPITDGVAGAAVAGSDQVSLSEIACVSASSCVAVGGNDAAPQGVVVPITNGVLGVAQSVPGTGFLNDVACDPSGACIAVGQNDQFNAGVVVPISAGTAGAPQSVPSTGVLLGVSCPATGSCVSVGVSADFTTGVVVPIQAGVPGSAELVAGTNVLGDIVCRTPSVCTAVGYQFSNGQLFAVPVVNGAPGATQSTPEGLGVNPSSVACPSSELCLTVGNFGLVASIVDGAPAIYQNVAGISFLGDLACPVATDCVAVGQTSSGEGAVLSFPPGTGAQATTAVTVTPSAGSFGQTVSATATVSSPAGTPTGEVFFSVDGVFFDYPQTLDGSGQTVFTINGLAPGSHSITAAYVGQPGAFSPGGTFYQPGSATASLGVACATTITGQQNRSFNITQPATCLSGAQVSGSINVQAGASLSIDRSTINGSINANRTGVFRMCASTVGGSLNITKATGYVLVGDRTPVEDDDNCAANTVHGSVNLVNDTSGIKAIGNGIGGSFNTGNDSGRGGYPFELAPELAPNTLLSTGQSTFLATRQNGAQGQTVDGIQCNTSEQVVSHTHAHVAIFANGQPLAIPEGVGMVGPLAESPTPYGPFAFPASGCLYWVHVHDQTGIIHMELPAAMTVTLGDLFDIWGQPLSTTQAGPKHGHVTAFVNGTLYTGNPRDIVLGDHTLVQLDIGGPVVPPQPFEFLAALP